MSLIYLLCICSTMLEELTSLKRYALPEADEYYSYAEGFISITHLGTVCQMADRE